MKGVRRIACAVAALSTLTAIRICEADTTQQDATRIVIKMQEAVDRQRAGLCAYIVDRRYTLQNEHLHPSAQMKVRLTYEQGKGKRFQVLSMQAEGIARRSLNELLSNESEPDQGQKESTDFDRSNYWFYSLGQETFREWRCYKLQLKPRRKSKYLIDGTLWVNTTDYAVVRVVGRLAKSPSFWIQHPAIEQLFANTNGFWLPSYMRSTMHLRFFGDAALTIEYSGYQIRACKDNGSGRH